MRTYRINTSKDLQLDFDYGHFQELSKEIINDIYKGHKIQYIGSGCMAWEYYDFNATIDDSTVKAHIDYKSKTCTLTETRFGKPVDLLEKGSQSTNMNNY